MGGYRTGSGKFDQKPDGHRASPAFMPAAQLDLITLTLEILARDSFADAATSQREAFRVAFEEFVQVAFIQAKEKAEEQRLGWPLAQMRALSASDQEALARINTQAVDSIEMVKRALGPMVRSLQLQSVDMPTPHDTSPPQVPMSQIVPTPAALTAGPDDGPTPAHASLSQRSPIELIPSLPYSTASSSTWREAEAGEFGHSPV
ncbi:hypothetical protein H4582DRAFT_1941885 [Lactarius indigo]|nr:hypothetical protein H4582DRAFT_1941885 [Lactarius indigo]